jgi:hypothetical protein
VIHDPSRQIRAALDTIEQFRPSVAAAWDGQGFSPVHAGELRRAAEALRQAVAALADVTALVALAGDDDQAVLCFGCLGAGVATCCHCYGSGVEMSAEQAAELAERLRASMAETVWGAQ